MPLTIPKHLAGLIPRGVGTKEITAAAPFQEAARGVVSTINRIVGEMGWQVELWGTATSFQFFLPLKPFLWHR